MSAASQLTIVFVVGSICQYLAWRLRLPSIVLLVPSGIILGAGIGWLSPDDLFSGSFSSVVSLSVAVILFEGGLTLRAKDFTDVGKPVIRLITVGAIITWIITALASFVFLDLTIQTSLLLGAVLVVSGPTVIGPILRVLHVKPPLGGILRWEGILIDPVGVILAVLVAEAVSEGAYASAPIKIASGMIMSIAVGSISGWIAAQSSLFLLRRNLMPDHLQMPTVLSLVLLSFTAANAVHHESGLVAVILMGLMIANRGGNETRFITEFFENLQMVLIPFLFLLLSAALTRADIDSALTFASIPFLLTVILIARPISVFVSTRKTTLDRNDKLFLSSVFPRGIVAASLASLLADSAVRGGLTDAHMLVPLTFLTIIATVALYGLLGPLSAQMLGVRLQDPQGVVFLGAGPFVRALAKALKSHGFRALIVDSNPRNIRRARKEGLEGIVGNLLLGSTLELVNMDGCGKLIAATDSEETNALACVEFAPQFSRTHVYQIPNSSLEEKESTVNSSFGRVLFDRGVNKEELDRKALSSEALLSIEAAQLDRDRDLIIAVISGNRLAFPTRSVAIEPKAGDTVIVVRNGSES